MPESPAAKLRVGLIGRGSIGGPVIKALTAGDIPGAVLSGVVTSGRTDGPGDADLPLCSIDDLIGRSDLIIEAAGQGPLTSYGAGIIAGGVDLLVLSVGALGDPTVRENLQRGPGRLFICSGAIGGLDLLRAVAVEGGLSSVTMTSTKLSKTLIQDWMDAALVEQIRTSTAPVEVFRGTPLEAASAFPKSANIALAVALAANSWDLVEVVMLADPAATLTEHVLEIDSESGRYRFEIAHFPSPENPASAAVVPLAVLRSLKDLVGRQDGIII